MSLGIVSRSFKRGSPHQGTTIDGNPVIQTPGSLLYVDATRVAPANWSNTCSTIQSAVNAAVSGRGDIIFIAPGTYSENVVINKNKLSLIAAVQSGNSKRVVVSATTGNALDVAQVTSFYAKGISFYAAASDAVLTDSEGSLFEDCDFRSDTGSGIVFFADTDNDFTGSGTIIYRSLIRECASATGALLLKKGGPTASDPGYGLQATNVNIWENQFYGNTGPDIADDGGTENPTYFHQWDISGNRFMTKDKATYLDMDTGTAGGTDCLISGNYFNDAALDLTNAIKLPTNGQLAGNFAKGGVGAIINAV